MAEGLRQFGYFGTPKPWQVAWSSGMVHPAYRSLWRELACCVPFTQRGGAPREVLTNKELTLSGTSVTWEYGRAGQGIKSTSGRYQFTISPDIAVDQPHSWVLIADGSDDLTAVRRVLRILNDASASAALCQWDGASGGDPGQVQVVTSAGGFTPITRVLPYVSQVPYFVGLTWDGATARVWDGPDQVNSAAHTTNRLLRTIYLAADTTGNAAQGIVYFFGLWRRVLTQAELGLLKFDPYGMVRIARRGSRILTVLAGAGATLVPDATIAAGGWQDQVGGSSDLHSPVTDDSDATWIKPTTIGDLAKLGNTDVVPDTDPASFTFRVRKNS